MLCLHTSSTMVVGGIYHKSKWAVTKAELGSYNTVNVSEIAERVVVTDLACTE